MGSYLIWKVRKSSPSQRYSRLSGAPGSDITTVRQGTGSGRRATFKILTGVCASCHKGPADDNMRLVSRPGRGAPKSAVRVLLTQ